MKYQRIDLELEKYQSVDIISASQEVEDPTVAPTEPTTKYDPYKNDKWWDFSYKFPLKRANSKTGVGSLLFIISIRVIPSGVDESLLQPFRLATCVSIHFPFTETACQVHFLMN